MDFPATALGSILLSFIKTLASLFNCSDFATTLSTLVSNSLVSVSSPRVDTFSSKLLTSSNNIGVSTSNWTISSGPKSDGLIDNTGWALSMIVCIFSIVLSTIFCRLLALFLFSISLSCFNES